VLNGADDPFVPAEQVAGFQQEMMAANANYTIILYEGAKHAFSVKGADEKGEKFGLPMAYNAGADRASWAEIQTFLKEIFD
jgi:dienelactone hydrolase